MAEQGEWGGNAVAKKETPAQAGMQSMFGKPDRKGGEEDGHVQSEYSAWMMNSQIDSLDNEIEELKSDLNGGRIPGSDVFEAKEELALKEEKFDDIVISKPNYSPSEENFLHGELMRMNSDMADTLYSRYDQQKGKGSIARPQQEADLNDKPCIKINSEVAKICNINNAVNGFVSRNMIDKARKILCAYFGRDDASRESIRPENNSSRQRPMVGYVNNAFDKAHKRIFGTKKAMDPNKLGAYNEAQETPSLDSAEIIKARIKGLQDQITLMEGNATKEINTITPEVETPKREVKAGKTYICPELGCGFVGKSTQAGAHVGKHNRAKKKLAEELKEE